MAALQNGGAWETRDGRYWQPRGTHWMLPVGFRADTELTVSRLLSISIRSRSGSSSARAVPRRPSQSSACLLEPAP